MTTSEEVQLRTDFVINDQARGYPTRSVEVAVTRRKLDHLVRHGYLVRRRLLPAALVAVLATAVQRLAEAEAGQPGAEWVDGESSYLRNLLDKDAVFHQLIRLEPALSIARTLLGPQVWIDLEARVHYPGRAGVSVPWHSHLPVIPSPVPAFFSYPHQIHCLVYLDRVSEQEGALCLIPGSHTRPDLRIPLGDSSGRADQVDLFFEAGDAVLIHGNLWHRTAPSTETAGRRRLLLLGYVPSWIRNEFGRLGVAPEEPLTAALARTADPETRELLGEFSW